MKSCLSTLLVVLLGIGLAACVVPIDDEPAEATSETEQSLVVSNWSAPGQISATTIWYAQVGTLGNTTYMVHLGPGYQLRWRQLVGSNWTEPVLIPNQFSGQRVSLAPFNGFLYMVYSDRTNTTRLWVSKFNPATSQWSTAFQIPHISYGPPALAAYNGRLYLIGIDPASKKLWSATMSATEVFTPSSPMEGHFSHGRVSAAVANCKLYIAHRGGASTTVVYNSFNGTSWGFDQTIPAGPGGAALVAAEPVIAERAGYLHLLHRDNGSSSSVPVWWTYFDGATWSSEVTIGGASTFYPPALTSGGAGLVAVTTTYYNSLASSLQYSQSLPLFPPFCFVVQPPIVTSP